MLQVELYLKELNSFELNSKTGHIVDNCTLPSVEDGTYEDDDDDDDNQSNETDDN